MFLCPADATGNLLPEVCPGEKRMTICLESAYNGIMIDTINFIIPLKR